MKRRNFTLVEMIVVVIVIAILATLGIPTYDYLVQKSRAKTCKVNQKVLLGALEAYLEENYQLPGALSQLKDSQIKSAWAKVLKEEGVGIKIAKFIVDFDQHGLAYAQTWFYKYGGELNQIICPNDTDGAPSYALNSALSNVDQAGYDAYPGWITADASQVDAVSGTTSSPKHVHSRYNLLDSRQFGIVMTKAGKAGYHFDSGIITPSASKHTSASPSKGIKEEQTSENKSESTTPLDTSSASDQPLKNVDTESHEEEGLMSSQSTPVNDQPTGTSSESIDYSSSDNDDSTTKSEYSNTESEPEIQKSEYSNTESEPEIQKTKSTVTEDTSRKNESGGFLGFLKKCWNWLTGK